MHSSLSCLALRLGFVLFVPPQSQPNSQLPMIHFHSPRCSLSVYSLVNLFIDFTQAIAQCPSHFQSPHSTTFSHQHLTITICSSRRNIDRFTVFPFHNQHS